MLNNQINSIRYPVSLPLHSPFVGEGARDEHRALLHGHTLSKGNVIFKTSLIFLNNLLIPEKKKKKPKLKTNGNFASDKLNHTLLRIITKTSFH